jgi:hypothetical protein
LSKPANGSVTGKVVYVQILKRTRFFCALVIASLSIGAFSALPALAGIVYNAVYECPGMGHTFVPIVVLSCGANDQCKISYPKGNGGRGFTSMINKKSLTESINGTSVGSYGKCTVNGKYVRAETVVWAPLHTAAPAVKYGGAMVMGRYECWTYSGGRLEAAMMENFTLYGGGRYTDAGGHSGSYTVSGGMITFRSAALNGVRGGYIQGRVGSNNPPHVQFVNAHGNGDECDGKG